MAFTSIGFVTCHRLVWSISTDECLLDLGKLLVFYNPIAEQAGAIGATLATWSLQLIAKTSQPKLT